MSRTKPKPVICWGLFRMAGRPELAASDHGLSHSSYDAMKVTSFSTTSAGTRMAHGQCLVTGASVHRQADGMFFYQSRESMDRAIVVANKREPKLVVEVYAALEKSASVQRAYRIDMELALGKEAIQPLELEL